MSRQSAFPKYTPDRLWPVFQHLLPVQVIKQLLAEYVRKAGLKRGFYQSLFPPLVVLWGFIYQRLSPDHTCDGFLSAYLSQEHPPAWRAAGPAPRRRPSENTGGYCKARQRLPLEVAQGALRHTAETLQAEWGLEGLWWGWRVLLLDGSTLRLPAEAELMEHYGTASNQHGPCHWPILRLVAAFDLFGGGLWGVAEGAYARSEHSLSAELIGSLDADFLYVGDRNFGVYHMLQVIEAAHSQALLRLKITQARRLGGKNLSPGCDLDVVWSPSPYDTLEPGQPTPAISGRLIYERLEMNGFRPIDLYLFTTLTDREWYPAAELVALYGQRYNVELDLRHIKTTLDMNQLEGQSVDIVRKELLLGLLAYNLIRGLMGQAALRAQRHPLELSFASGLRRMLTTLQRVPARASPTEIECLLEELLERLGRCLLPKRKRQRFEPRAVWGKPRVYPTLKGSREQARQACLEKLKANIQ
jgi:putative transposase